MISFGINALIALLWLLLSSTPNLGSLVFGWIFGFAIVFAFQRLLGSQGYVQRTFAFCRFLVLFVREVSLSTFEIARAVLFKPIRDIDPDFIQLDVSDLSKGEILLLSHCITLTPGTTSVDISKDFRVLTVHAFDAADPDAVRASIQSGLRDPILAFTRPWKSS